MGSGVIIAATQPDPINLYTWMKPLPGGGKEYYEVVEGVWTKVLEDESGQVGTVTFDPGSNHAAPTHFIRKLKVTNGRVEELEIEEVT